ncbi:MAG: NADPH:quinone oxidoreductase family protein [Anaerolineaceae bacterium]|nr:NADPH:quinone oxidoreductase family protein [Anaerolineaceae bacterium]
MKALLSTSIGGPESLVIEDVSAPTPARGQLLIEVKAVGVNYPDVLIIEDKYQYKPQRPFSPGGEIAGVVVVLGEGVEGFSPGDRVLGFCGWGGMAEQIVVDASRCSRLPATMPFDEAATFLFTYGTSHYALKWRGQLKAGEKLLVLGAAGGVGLAAVQLARAAGAEVIAACSTQEKVDLCLSKGADHGLIYPTGKLDRAAQRELSEQIKSLSGGGVDVVYDAVGGDYAEPALRAMNWEGRYLVVGFPAGIPAIPFNLPLLKSCDIRGVFWGAWVERQPDELQQSLAELFQLYEQGSIRPHISSRYPLAQTSEAIRELSERRATGKVVVEIG